MFSSQRKYNLTRLKKSRSWKKLKVWRHRSQNINNIFSPEVTRSVHNLVIYDIVAVQIQYHFDSKSRLSLKINH